MELREKEWRATVATAPTHYTSLYRPTYAEPYLGSYGPPVPEYRYSSPIRYGSPPRYGGYPWRHPLDDPYLPGEKNLDPPGGKGGIKDANEPPKDKGPNQK